MPTILLIRHGENDFIGKRLAGRLPEVHLNEKGRQQAERVGQALSRVPIKAIYSSPLERAVETATPLANLLQLPVQVLPGLMETDIGDWTGASLPRLRRLKIWKAVQETPAQFRFPGGETFRDTQQRIVQQIEALAASHDAQDLIACFSHCDPIRVLLAHMLGMPLDNFQRLSIETASLSVLSIKDGHAHVGTINLNLSFQFSVDLAPLFSPHPKAIKPQGTKEK